LAGYIDIFYAKIPDLPSGVNTAEKTNIITAGLIDRKVGNDKSLTIEDPCKCRDNRR
jgi:hypothetical protein